MKVVLQGLGCMALLAVTWLVAEAAWTVRQVRPHLEVTLTNLDRTIIIAGAAATHLEKASGTWEKSSREQTLKTTAAMSNVSVAAKRLTTLISNTDTSISGLLLSTQNAIIQQNASLLDTQVALRQSLISTQKASDEARQVLVDADAQINSPDIKIALDNVATSSQNLAIATGEGAATMKEVRIAVDKEVEALLAPVNKAKMIVLFTAQLIGRLYGF